MTVLSRRHPQEFQMVFSSQVDPPPCKDEIDDLMKSIGVLKI